MMKTILQFIGLSPGQPPWGREPLFQVKEQVLTKGQLIRLGVQIPQEQEIQIQRALNDWNNSATCDDNLVLLR